MKRVIALMLAVLAIQFSGTASASCQVSINMMSDLDRKILIGAKFNPILYKDMKNKYIFNHVVMGYAIDASRVPEDRISLVAVGSIEDSSGFLVVRGHGFETMIEGYFFQSGYCWYGSTGSDRDDGGCNGGTSLSFFPYSISEKYWRALTNEISTEFCISLPKYGAVPGIYTTIDASDVWQ